MQKDVPFEMAAAAAVEAGKLPCADAAATGGTLHARGRGGGGRRGGTRRARRRRRREEVAERWLIERRIGDGRSRANRFCFGNALAERLLGTHGRVKEYRYSSG